MPLTALSGFDGLGDAPRLAETILALMPDTGILVIDTDMRFVLVEGGVYARHGYDTKTFVGRDIREVIPAAAWSRLGELWIGALAGEPSELDWESVDTKREYWLHFVPLRTRADQVVGALGLAQDITERVRARAQVLHRLTLQGAVSSLGSMALGSVALDDLLPLAARVVHDGLGTDLIVVLEHTAEGAVVRASAGEADPPSPDELRFDGGETFLSHDLRSEARFQAPGLEAAGMRSLIAAPIGSGATGVRIRGRVQPAAGGLRRGRQGVRGVDRERADVRGRTCPRGGARGGGRDADVAVLGAVARPARDLLLRRPLRRRQRRVGADRSAGRRRS